jgi:hypothetical protein
MPATRNRVRIGHRVPKTLRSCPEYASPTRLPCRLSSQAIHHEFLEAPHRVFPHRRQYAPAGCRIGHAPLLEALANCLVLQVHATPEPCELLHALRRSRLWAEAVDGAALPGAIRRQRHVEVHAYVFNLCPWSDWANLATCFQISSHRCLISALSASAKSSSIL